MTKYAIGINIIYRAMGRNGVRAEWATNQLHLAKLETRLAKISAISLDLIARTATAGLLA